MCHSGALACEQVAEVMIPGGFEAHQERVAMGNIATESGRYSDAVGL